MHFACFEDIFERFCGSGSGYIFSLKKDPRTHIKKVCESKFKDTTLQKGNFFLIMAYTCSVGGFATIIITPQGDIILPHVVTTAVMQKVM